MESGAVLTEDTAIDRVLEAERAVVREIAECQRRAEAELAAARERARAILDRSEQRLARVAELCTSAAEEAERAAERSDEEPPADLDPADLERLECVLKSMAERLTTTDDDQS